MEATRKTPLQLWYSWRQVSGFAEAVDHGMKRLAYECPVNSKDRKWPWLASNSFHSCHAFMASRQFVAIPRARI